MQHTSGGLHSSRLLLPLLPPSLSPSPLSGCLLPLYTLPPALSCTVPPLPPSLPPSHQAICSKAQIHQGKERDSKGDCGGLKWRERVSKGKGEQNKSERQTERGRKGGGEPDRKRHGEGVREREKRGRG